MTSRGSIHYLGETGDPHISLHIPLLLTPLLTVFRRYIELCVELRDHVQGKDGLHQYRNMSQAQAPGSLEVVIRFYVDLSEQKAEAAASAAQQRAIAAAEKVGDLEAEETPESIMMSTMTEVRSLAYMPAAGGRSQRLRR